MDDAKIKELSWINDVAGEDEKSKNLRDLIEFIQGIIESKEEYKKLPPPKAGCL